MKQLFYGPLLNGYPDSIGGELSGTISLLQDEWRNCFDGYYILPSIFHSDLDRGFSVIDYDLNEEYASREDLQKLKDLGIALKLDIVLNHQSVQSKEFQDLLQKGEESEYKDYFIAWNKFWEGHGEMSPDGYIVPDKQFLDKMFFRKPGLPLLMVEFPDGSKVPYWNTFYQKVTREGGKTVYQGQMDVNIESPLVWDHYEKVMQKLAGYGAQIVRLDAFAYASKKVGKPNFLNEPETWEILERVHRLAAPYGVTLLPEIHEAYEKGIYRKIASMGYFTYDFFLPGLLLYAIEFHNPQKLVEWARELRDQKINTVNMLGCHDGLPVLDLKGLLSDDEIQKLIDLLVSRGGYVKDLHGAKNMYYQVNCTYYSALGEDAKKMEFARAVQMFMPGIPEVWYLDLLAGKNDYEALKRGGHKEINRTNLTLCEAKAACQKPVVQQQIELLEFRKNCPAFGPDSEFDVSQEGSAVTFSWRGEGSRAELQADFATYEYEISEM